jgi:hypothetical protein
MSFRVIPYLLVIDLISKKTVPPDSSSSGLIVPFDEFINISPFESQHPPWLLLAITRTIPPDARQLASICHLIDQW